MQHQYDSISILAEARQQDLRACADRYRTVQLARTGTSAPSRLSTLFRSTVSRFSVRGVTVKPANLLESSAKAGMIEIAS
jgi:hypothetical protein